MALRSKEFTNKKEAEKFIAKHGGYYEVFVGPWLTATFVVFYNRFRHITEEKEELYKAVKWEVEHFQADHGCNMAEMWELVNAKTPGFENRAQWWNESCLDDYREQRA